MDSSGGHGCMQIYDINFDVQERTSTKVGEGDLKKKNLEHKYS